MVKKDTMKDGRGAANAAKSGGLGIGKLVGGLVGLCVLVALVLFALGNVAGPSLYTFANSDAAVPQVYSAALSQSNTSMAMLSSLIVAHYNATQQFHVNYTGKVYVKLSGTAGSVIGAIDSPVSVWLAQYGSSHKLSASATSVPLVGALSAQYASLSNGSYVCANFNTTAASDGSVSALASKSSMCKGGTDLAGVNLAKLYNFDFSQLQGMGLNFKYTNSYESTFQGTPCTVIEGTLSGQDGSGTYLMCMSNTYYVPLSIGISLSGSQGSVILILNETGIGNSSVQGAVNSLPYP